MIETYVCVTTSRQPQHVEESAQQRATQCVTENPPRCADILQELQATYGC
jgi:hypothetical protein